MPLTISREQRDAIHELLVEHLTGIGDIWIEFEKHELAPAKRLAQEYVEELRLLNDIGWDETVHTEMVSLTRPVDELVRTLLRLHKAAVGALGTYVSRPKDDEDRAAKDLLATTALAEVLRQLAEVAQADHAESEVGTGEEPGQ